MICSHCLIFSTIFFDLGLINSKEINSSESIRKDSRSLFDIPRVPGSKLDDDLGYRNDNRDLRYDDDKFQENYQNYGHNNRDRDYHYNYKEYEDRNPDYGNSKMGPCEALINKFKEELSNDDATVRLQSRGNVHNSFPMSYQVC